MSPVVDVVMLSRADTPALATMTMQAIQSCILGAPLHDVNVIVMEQAPGVNYPLAPVDPNSAYQFPILTVRNERPDFNYNWTANAGAKFGSAPWVMVANNDLVFEPGWLTALLEAGQPLVSPVDPGNARQSCIQQPTAGTQTGVHLSGWCFMIERRLLNHIGGLDERLSFWCSDDALIQQALAVNVLPVVVPDAKVHHLVSATLHTRNDQDDLTWAQVYLFNQIYDQQLGHDNPRYRRWLAAQR